MADRGFGSPSSFAASTALTSYDRAFGSPSSFSPPTAESVRDEGFGSPFTIIGAWVVEDGAEDPGRYPDDGGIVIKLRGAWPTTGPYRVRLVDASGGEHPDVDGAYSGIMGEGPLCQTNGAQDELVFVLPAGLDTGLYSIRVYYGIGYSEQQVITDALRIVRRTRPHATYRIRARHSRHFKTGPRAAQRERLLLP